MTPKRPSKKIYGERDQIHLRVTAEEKKRIQMHALVRGETVLAMFLRLWRAEQAHPAPAPVTSGGKTPKETRRAIKKLGKFQLHTR